MWQRFQQRKAPCNLAKNADIIAVSSLQDVSKEAADLILMDGALALDDCALSRIWDNM